MPSSATPFGLSADETINMLGMTPHPEGGHFVETYRGGDAFSLGLPASFADRGEVTSIYFLLKAGERSHWHRVIGTEIWHHYRGDPLSLGIAQSDHDSPVYFKLGGELQLDQRPQAVVPSGAWQAAECLASSDNGFSLVGCTGSPGFTFSGFELAPPSWTPGPHNGVSS